MKKRIISLVLVLAMALGLAPGVFAAGTETEAYWPNFRNGLYNMAITSAATPTSAATTVEKWVGTYGSGWSNSPSALIIADDALVFMNAKSLKKVNLQTGKLLAEGTMSASGGYVIISPTYADGMVFCPLSGGKIEAFDVETLESKWIFSDTLGGQNNTPITYFDGRLYTGFWNGEEKEANFVCVDASTGALVWSKAVSGGFYWAGSTVVGNAVIVGSDDGASGFKGDSHLFALNRLTGEVISDITLTGMGDQRSAIAYSQEKGRVYFTTKNGYIASAAVDAESGALSDLKSNKVSSQATATPVVYGDKVYFGAGSGMREGSTAGNFFVVDASSLEYLYEIPLLGYPQGSIMISTAYLEETGKLYCYATYNNKPGGLTLIRIDPTKNTADSAELEEIYAAPGHEQYCLISPICGPDGTIYYRNDSGCIFALTNNEAYLTGLTADVGTFSGKFAANQLSYELVVPKGTASATLTPTACEGGSAEAVTVMLTEGTASAEIVVTKGGSSRTYAVSIREISSDATLSELKVNESNSYTGAALALTPEFDAGSYYYSVLNAGSGRSFENVWPTAADSNATVTMYAISNVRDDSFDPETGMIEVTAASMGHDRYAVYFGDDTKAMAVRIVVTAEDGTSASYVLVMSKEGAAGDGAALLEQIKAADKLASDQAAAQAVMDLIGAIGEVTLDSADAIEAARTAYDALTKEQKSLVTNYDVLVAAEARLEEVKDEATADPVDIYVTIANKGSVVMAQKKITVTDVNNNGFFDVDDALYAAHEAGYEGGAAAGYASYESWWGLSISMLWGDTSYCYGYWLNNASCWSLEDTVSEGSHLVAFVYTDGDTWSDSYSRFEKFDYTATVDTALTVKLEKADYDENRNTIFTAHPGAAITVYDADMKAVAASVTDNGDGTYTVVIADPGTYYVVATDSDPITVPAVCAVTVSARAVEPGNPSIPETGDSSNMVLMTAVLLISLWGMVALTMALKKRSF